MREEHADPPRMPLRGVVKNTVAPTVRATWNEWQPVSIKAHGN